MYIGYFGSSVHVVLLSSKFQATVHIFTFCFFSYILFFFFFFFVGEWHANIYALFMVYSMIFCCTPLNKALVIHAQQFV